MSTEERSSSILEEKEAFLTAVVVAPPEPLKRLAGVAGDHDAARRQAMETMRTNFFIVLNIVSSVGIVATNKYIFQIYNFRFGTLLTFLHFLVTFLGLRVCAYLGVFQKKHIDIVSVLPLCLSFCGFVVLTNLSLQFNSVGFYQMAKVLTTPCVVVIQIFWLKMSFSKKIQLSLLITCVGVTIASVTDMKMNFLGTIFALAGVVVTSLYQIWVGTKQKELDVDSFQLLYYQAPLSALLLIALIPLFDSMPDLYEYAYTSEVMVVIFISCLFAFLVNISTFMIIGRASAITYNVVGHFKLCLIILFGFTFFDEAVDMRNIVGIVITLSGVFAYTHFKLNGE